MTRPLVFLCLTGLLSPLALTEECENDPTPTPEPMTPWPTATPPLNPTPIPCAGEELTVITSDFFEDISEESGIRLNNFYENPPAGTVINDHSRLAFADINGDGFDDAVMHSLYPNAQNGVPFEHLVFLNNGNGTFTDFSDASGLRDIQAGFFAFGDVDNDGDQDVFAGLDILGLGDYRHQILLNDGAGHFTAVVDSGVDALRQTMAANAAFADFDGDGILDLYIGNGGTTYASTDNLFLGQGDGRFTNVSERLAGNPSQPSNGSITCDFDNDGDLDIFVSTYSVSTGYGLNILWQNDGAHFTNVAVEKGVASLPGGNYYLASTDYGQAEEPGKEPGTYIGSNGFGVDCGDINNDGNMDIFLTAISHPVSSDYNRKWSDPSQVLVNLGAEGGYAFENQFQEMDLPFNEGDVDGGMVDYDNDGRLDLSVSRDRKYENNYDTVDQKSWFGLMRQRPDGQFDSLGVPSGINDPDQELLRMKGAQNHVWSDIDHDGDLDLLVGGRDQGGGRPNFLFENTVGSENQWLALHLEGDGEAINRDAIGTRVILQYEDNLIMREKKSSRGMYNSEDTRVMHFGMGDLGCNYQMRVIWPNGNTQILRHWELPTNGHITLRYPDILE